MFKIERIILVGLLMGTFCFSSDAVGQEYGLDSCTIEEIVVFGNPSLVIEFETPMPEDIIPQLLVLRSSFNIQGSPNENFQKYVFDVIPWHQELTESEARSSISGSYWVLDGENVSLDLTHTAQCQEGVLRVRCLLTPLSLASNVDVFNISHQKGLLTGGLDLFMPPVGANFSSGYSWDGGRAVDPPVSIIDNNMGSSEIQFAAYPNPFNAMLNFQFTAPAGQVVSGRLDIYDLRGYRLVSDQILFEGEYVYTWDGKTEAGAIVSSGNYFVSFTNKGNGKKTTLPVLLLK